jgi:hypothetical protein
MPESYKHKFLREGRLSGIGFSPKEDTSKSFSLNNRGELTTGEYVSYLALLENHELRRSARFPPVNPTKEDYSNLVKLAEKLELDF